jgi:hypothetical protein
MDGSNAGHFPAVLPLGAYLFLESFLRSDIETDRNAKKDDLGKSCISIRHFVAGIFI